MLIGTFPQITDHMSVHLKINYFLISVPDRIIIYFIILFTLEEKQQSKITYGCYSYKFFQPFFKLLIVSCFSRQVVLILFQSPSNIRDNFIKQGLSICPVCDCSLGKLTHQFFSKFGMVFKSHLKLWVTARSC